MRTSSATSPPASGTSSADEAAPTRRRSRPDVGGVIADIEAETVDLGADAVVGATFDYEEMAEGMLWVILSGTPVETRRR